MTSGSGRSHGAIAHPADLAAVRDVMLDTAGPLLFTGGKTKLGWGVPPAGGGTVVSSDALTALLRYDPGDATVAVEAGMAVADLQGILARHDQWLAVDPPHVAEGATVGGLVASGDAGPQRVAHGTMRDLVIGATYVLSDGAVGRTGGFVIKNVAGYDIAKLLCGSLGTLAFVAEVVLRVDPRPAAHATLRVPADAVGATAVGRALGAAAVEPVAVEWDGDAVWIRFAGRRDVVRAEAAAAAALLDGVAGGPVGLVDGADEDTAWAQLTAALAGEPGDTVVRGACLPTVVADAARACARAADAAGVEALLQATVVLGVLTARIRGGDRSAHAAFVADWRRRLRALGGHAVVRRTADGVAEVVDVWGPPPPAIGLMRRVKAQLDPAGRCAPGRFVGGI